MMTSIIPFELRLAAVLDCAFTQFSHTYLPPSLRKANLAHFGNIPKFIVQSIACRCVVGKDRSVFKVERPNRCTSCRLRCGLAVCCVQQLAAFLGCVY